ncbi:CRISPR system precrRNA processing endoribonuclease RAMP protein Cas6 [Heliophilum fasciatum]|uniref:Uncharacterized protein DUF2276 n=1 Tax=Heliophilum fasciatum TaxID=35700 RepID=A0A4R2RFQ6_9FIRM|nr:CRISPR system precrRNA processing endoribonuclease RAMP protein Cas6 [Heliophilum fasciatum]MCW2279020.1 hypothetical protein [Heliophilum fasciatum]TCP61743.1 uncharacterized protein DUF2276 [Heliophilum fasciatum]
MDIPCMTTFIHPKLSCQCLRITVEAGAQGLLLPPYPGSTLRGALGRALHQLACTASKNMDCEGCFFRQVCPVTLLFRPILPEGREGFFAKGQDLPAPFVLRPRTHGKTQFYAGQRFDVDLTVFGKVIPYLPYLLAALTQAVEKGLGKERRKAVIVDGAVINPLTEEKHPVFDGETWALTGSPSIQPEQVAQAVQTLAGLERLKVRLETPLRLKADEHLQNRISASVLVRGLARRISVLAAFYGEEPWAEDFPELLRLAETVGVEVDHYRWVDWERYSSRQDCRMKLGGLVGELVLSGAGLEKLLPLFVWGQLTHVGKATSFGLGAMRVSYE